MPPRIKGVCEKNQHLTEFWQSRIELSQVFESCPVPIAVSTAREGVIVDANRSFLDLIGYNREEVIGRTSAELSIWVYPEFRDPYVQKTLSKGSIRDLEVSLRTKTGLVKETIAGSEVLHANGCDYLISSFADITKLKHVQAALKDSEERFHGIVEITSDWIWELDAKGRYTFVSPRIRSFAGYEPEELIGRRHTEFVSPDDAKQLDKDLLPVWKSRKPISYYEGVILTKDGSKMYVEAGGMPIFDANGIFRGYRGASRDITARKKAEEELQKREEELRMKSENLQEANMALKVLLQQREKDRSEFEERMIANVKEMIQPYVDRLRSSNLTKHQSMCITVVESNLKEIISPFLQHMKMNFINFTPKELQIAGLIRDGRTSKEIANILQVSKSAVELHRSHIRAKLGLNRKKVNLQSHLVNFP